jgi:lysophospholipid acyltransferase (LPLAT)-like uncharacterized protein
MKGSSDRAVYSFWHRDIMVLGYSHRNEGIRVLVSEHDDGELAARVIRRMGYTYFRGSTTHGGMKALRDLLSIKADPTFSDIAITPDGPKGPRMKLKKGVIFVASKTEFPIVPMGVAVSRSWELNSWDGFRIPKLFSRCFIYYGDEIPVPRKLDDDEMDRMRDHVEQKMYETEELAKEELRKWIDGT